MREGVRYNGCRWSGDAPKHETETDMNKLSNKATFKIAHAITGLMTQKHGGDYRATFGLVLGSIMRGERIFGAVNVVILADTPKSSVIRRTMKIEGVTVGAYAAAHAAHARSLVSPDRLMVEAGTIALGETVSAVVAGRVLSFPAVSFGRTFERRGTTYCYAYRVAA